MAEIQGNYTIEDVRKNKQRIKDAREALYNLKINEDFEDLFNHWKGLTAKNFKKKYENVNVSLNNLKDRYKTFSNIIEGLDKGLESVSINIK